MSSFGDYEVKPFLADLYDFVPRYSGKRDVDFYVDLCRESGGKVLELGCGTGRVLTPIASAGIEVVGLDLSPHMLAKCKQNLYSQPEPIQNRIRLIEASMTDFDLGEEFSAVIIPFRPFQHLISVADQMACLRCAHRHLHNNGILAFDLFQVDFNKMTEPPSTEETEDLPEFELPDGRKLRMCSRFVATHRAEQYNEVEIVFYLTGLDGEKKRLVQAFPLRYFFRYEVEHLLARTGFDLVSIYGDFDKSPLGDDSPEMIFVARKGVDKNNVEDISAHRADF